MSTAQKQHVRVASAEIEVDGSYLIVQRRPQATMPLLWEFPGGRVREGEGDVQALVRKLEELLGVVAEVGERSLRVTHEYDDYTLEQSVYRVKLVGAPTTVRVHDLRWVRPDEFDQYPFPGADQKTVDLLLVEG